MNNEKKNFLNSIVAVFVVVIFLISWNSARIFRPANIHKVKIAGQTLIVDVANTDDQRQLGLSFQKNIPIDRGMLFVFDYPDKYLIWMKGMNFSIDIIWIGEDMKVVYIKKNAQPEAFLETYGPNKNAKYVLEVSAGFSEKNNLKVGDGIEFVY